MTKTIILLTIVAAFVTGTITTTALVNADGGDGSLIHACITNTGNVRIVAAFEDCKSKEDPLHWSIMGTEGPQGPAGADGATGPQGPAGPDKNLFIRTETTVLSGTIVPSGSAFLFAECNSDEIATGGGYDNQGGVEVIDFRPNGNGWQGLFFNTNAFNVNFASLSVQCLKLE